MGMVPLCVLLVSADRHRLIAFRAKVVSVRDAAHIEVQFEGNKAWVRLSGIEVPSPDDGFGAEAKSYVTQRCFGKTVELDARKDPEGVVRFVAMVYTVTNERRDALSVNEGLIAGGLTRLQSETIDQSALEAVQLQAKAQKRGRWAVE